MTTTTRVPDVVHYGLHAKHVLVVPAGSRRALAAAVRAANAGRHTALAHRLQTTR